MLRVAADPAHDRRWELGPGEVFVYDTTTGALIRRIHLPGAIFADEREACLPGMVLTPAGSLIVSSNATPRLWFISATRFELERFEITPDTDTEKDFGFSSLAWAADGSLHAASAMMGTTWRIDLGSESAIRIGANAPARGACGP